MTGWFITSGYFQNDAVRYVELAFEKAFKKHGVGFCSYKSNDLLFYVDSRGNIQPPPLQKPDFVIFWDKDTNLASMIEKWGVRVFNDSRAIELCDDKVKTLLFLAQKGIDMPKTAFAPLVFGNREETDQKFVDNLLQAIGFPVIIKEANGSFGWQVYLARDRERLCQLRRKLVHTPHLYQEFVSTSVGKDVRVIVVGGKAVASMVRSNAKDFRANVELGGVAEYKEVSPHFAAMAEKAALALNLDYAGVDMLFGEEGKPLLCEVNSNAYFKGMESCLDIDIADLYLQHILESIQRLPYAKHSGN